MITSAISTLASQFSGLASAATGSAPAGTGFGDLLQSAIGNVDGLQSTADTKISNLLHGAPGADIGDVTVSVEKADIAFQLMMQVRNKVVSAYQDIEKMQF